MLDPTICHMRDHRECFCPAGQCASQPKPLPPHHSFPLPYQLSACVVIGAIAAFTFYVSVPKAMEASRQQVLAQQEQVNVNRN